ncbi:MAG TPA: hypothetical protein VG936_08995 [Lacunisphaera sp.]|nr:hypothetical protein [Lacunisphaera sp.]
MKLRLIPLGVLLAAAAGSAQTNDSAATSLDPATATAEQPAKRTVPNGRLPEAKRDRPAKYGKPVLPDPDLLDGSSYEKEKRPLHGMLSEIEIGEGEGGRQDKISPNSGPSGAGQPPEDQQEPKAGQQAQNAAQPAAGGQKPPEETAQAGGGADQKIPEGQQASAGGAGAAGKPGAAGPAAQAQGMQAANLKVPEGATGAVGATTGKPQQMQIGDATLQIQSAAQNNSDVVGTQASTAQQYDRKTPAGGSSAQSSGNVGVEKGRVVPKGL